MKVIKNGNVKSWDILGIQSIDYPYNRYKRHKYFIEVNNGEYRVLLNLLTNQIITLDFNEEIDYKFGIMNWWYIQDSLDEFTFVQTFRQLLRNKELFDKKFNFNEERFHTFVIMTTTACNARCSYCFEEGMEISTLKEDIVPDIVNFIEKNADDFEVNWFGGEPLFNIDIIDKITTEFKKRNLIFKSSLTTNGYLLTPELLARIDNDWHLYTIQITLDGSENDYLRIKDYANGDQKAYSKVLQNIKMACGMGYNVDVRLNAQPGNFDSLKQAIDDLDNILDDNERKYVRIYVAGITYQGMTDQVINDTFIAMIDIENYIVNHFNFTIQKYTNQYLPCASAVIDHCIISPKGELLNCDRVGKEAIVIGDIWKGIAAEASKILETEWLEHKDGGQEACKDCVFLPRCWRISKCAGHPDKCTDITKAYISNNLELELIEQAMEEGL